MYHLDSIVVNTLWEHWSECVSSLRSCSVFCCISVRCVTCSWNDLVYCCCIVLVRKLAGLCASVEEVQGSQKSVIQAATASGARESSVWDHATTTWFWSLPTSGNKVTTSPDQLKKRREENRSQSCVLDRIGHQSVQGMMLCRI